MRFLPSTIAITRPASTYIFMVILAFMGWSAYQDIPKEASPDIQIPLLIVTVPYPGSSPEDVEALITDKLETEFTGIEGLKKISSTSTEGAAVITLEFHLGINIDDARAKAREALDRVLYKLPKEAEDPTINEINLSERPIMIVNISGSLGLLRLRHIADDLKDEIDGIHGILEVQRAGGLEYEIKVDVDPRKLKYYNLDISQITDTIARENTSLPAGHIEVGSMKYNIRVPGEITNPDELKTLVITARDQVPIQIQDVAKVDFTFKEVTSRSRKNGSTSVSLSVSKRSGENLLAISDKIKALVASANKKYEGKVSFVTLNDQSLRVRTMVSDLENNIFTGLFFVLLVLFFSMGGKNALFIAAAIPLSMLLSFMVISWVGITLNIVVLFSLILALGMLVDNAIVVVENIYRHLEEGKTPLDASLTGVGEVAIPVITSTITTLVVFLPLISMPGIMGEFMGYLPKTLIITLTASLFVGLIFNPMLCATLMKKPHEHKGLTKRLTAKGSELQTKYRKWLLWSLGHPKKILFGLLASWFLLAMMTGSMVKNKTGVEFFPATEPSSVTLNITAPFGSSLATSNKIVAEIEQILFQYLEHTEAIVANVGLGQGSSANAGGNTSHLSHITISFLDWQERTISPSELIKDIRAKISHISGAKITMSKAQKGPRSGKAINIELYGNDLLELKKVAVEIQNRAKGVEGLINLTDNFSATRSEIQIRLDRQKIARLGLSTSQVAGAVRTAINGRVASTYRLNKEDIDITVRFDPEHRKSITDITGLYIKTPTGQSVPLSEIAKIITTASKGSIRHINGNKVITVSADVEGIPGPVGLQRVQATLEGYQVPAGVEIIYSGEDENRKEMQAYLGKAFFIAIFLIFLVLVSQFNSLLLPFIIMTSVFLSLIGVFFGMLVHQSPFSIMMGGIGIISLAGVVVNNAIVLIDYINQLRAAGIERFDAIIQAGLSRLRPVLLTAITTILGLIPVTIGMDINVYRFGIVAFGSDAGAMWVPMARSVIYGLGFATILTLIAVPVLYNEIEKMKEWSQKKRSWLFKQIVYFIAHSPEILLTAAQSSPLWIKKTLQATPGFLKTELRKSPARITEGAKLLLQFLKNIIPVALVILRSFTLGIKGILLFLFNEIKILLTNLKKGYKRGIHYLQLIRRITKK